jgi:hypothetical protein
MMASESTDAGATEKSDAPKTYVLCAGVDSSSAKDNFRGLSFRAMADQRLKMVAAKLRDQSSKADAQVVIFDFLAGTKETTGFEGGKQAGDVVVQKAFTPIVKEFYKERRADDGHPAFDFIPGQRGVMSITDIYKAVQDIGRSAPGTLQELSFFAHGDHNGPSFVNSWETWEAWEEKGLPSIGGATTAIMRDPDDKDGRAAKDFCFPNMTAEELGMFSRAFDAQGYLWVWGCNFPDDIHTLLTRVERSGKARLRDDTVIACERLTRMEVSIFLKYRDALKYDLKYDPKKPTAVRCQFQLGDFKKVLLAVVQQTYAYKAANLAKVRTIAPMLGTYAVPDKRKELMMVSADTYKHLDFYRYHFDVERDPESRDYGVIKAGSDLLKKPAAKGADTNE